MDRDQLAACRRINWSSLTSTHAQQRPDQDALRVGEMALTWAQLDTRVDRLANWLRSQRVAPGDRVAVLMTNRLEYLEILIAAARVGAIAVPINFRLSAAEVAFILGDCTPRVVCVQDALLPLLAADEHDASALVVGPEGDYDDALAGSPTEHVLTDVDDNATAMIMYTSGTTGSPKGAMLSHLNLFMQAVTGIRCFRMVGDDVVLVATPLFHIAAIGSLLPILVHGGTAVVAPSAAFDPAELLDVLEREQITNVFLVPAQWQAVVAQPGVADRKLALRTISWGAAPATPTLLAAMGEAFPTALNVAVFGQTEMSPVTCVLRGGDAQRKIGSVGRPVSYVQMRVVDLDGADVTPSEIGEAVYRGPTMMHGYWNRPDTDAFAGGWFHSGDLVRVDDEGFVYVVDRLKDMIISGGENIYCAEVENAVAAHPDVLDVAVVGRPSERWGEEPVAFIVPREGGTPPRIDELRDWLDGRLASYKRPREIRVADELPRNASGKVQKFALRQQVGAER